MIQALWGFLVHDSEPLKSGSLLTQLAAFVEGHDSVIFAALMITCTHAKISSVRDEDLSPTSAQPQQCEISGMSPNFPGTAVATERRQ